MVGFVTVDPKTGYLDQIVVAPEAWGSDVANAADGRSPAHFAGGLDLKVNADNARAIRFYEKQGFVDAGETVNETSGAPVRMMRWRPYGHWRATVLELQLRQPRIEPAGGGEALVGAFLDDAAFVHHQDAVAGQHGREPMRDHERGALRHQPLERGLHQRLALGIERGGRLVEQEQRRVAQDRARDRDALALAAGERDAALADRRLETLRQAVDEFGRQRKLGGALDLGVARVRPAEADVVGDRRGEDHRVLRHQRDAPAQRERIGVGDRHAVEA